MPSESSVVLVTNEEAEKRQIRALAKARTVAGAIGGALFGYFVGSSFAPVVHGEFAGAELVAPRFSFGKRIGWVPRFNLVIVSLVVVGGALGCAAVNPEHVVASDQWALRSAEGVRRLSNILPRMLPWPLPSSQEAATDAPPSSARANDDDERS
jgi:hypothetical protein